MQQEEKSKKRTSIGKISGIVGIFCNCILAGSKIIIGNFAGSMSIAADGLNNLSDLKLRKNRQTKYTLTGMPVPNIWRA